MGSMLSHCPEMTEFVIRVIASQRLPLYPQRQTLMQPAVMSVFVPIPDTLIICERVRRLMAADIGISLAKPEPQEPY